MSDDLIQVPMTREELRLLASVLNNGNLPAYISENYGEEVTFVCRLVGAKAGDTVRWDEKLLRRLGKWVDEDPNGEDGE